MMLKRVFNIALICFTATAIQGCNEFRRAQAQKPPLDRCMSDLYTIPEMGALLKSRGKGEEEVTGRPLEGMEIALTINGMIRSESDPEDELDNWCAAENSRENFDKLLKALKDNNMPPTVDFVIGRQVDQGLLNVWLQNGNLVGNMTFSRKKARKRPAQEFIEDVAQNDALLETLWAKHPPRQKYFRYPRLKLSKDSQNRDLFRAYLKEKSYQDAPATIDARDGKFAGIYCAAQARGDEACVNLIKAQFKSLLLDTTLRARASARERTGYEVKHILMVGANQFTCDFLGEILTYYRSLGAKFISLDQALSDPLYTIVDDKGKPAARAIMRETRRGQLSRPDE